MNGGCDPKNDVQPPGEHGCRAQARWGKCEEPWLLEGGFCEAACGRCQGNQQRREGEEEERLGTPAPPVIWEDKPTPPAACPEDPTKVTKEVGPCQKQEVRDDPVPPKEDDGSRCLLFEGCTTGPPTAGAQADASASASGGAQAIAGASASAGGTRASAEASASAGEAACTKSWDVCETLRRRSGND